MHHSPEAILEAGYRDASTSLFLETRIIPTIFTEDKFLVTANVLVDLRRQRAKKIHHWVMGGPVPCK
jgi:hypothetical protein